MAQSCYRVLESHRDIQAGRFQRAVDAVRRENWLASYRELAGVECALRGISKRCKRENPLASALTVLEANSGPLQSDFQVRFRNSKATRAACWNPPPGAATTTRQADTSQGPSPRERHRPTHPLIASRTQATLHSRRMSLAGRRWRTSAVLVGAAASASVLFSQLGPATEPATPGSGRPHVVLITVDTLRADHLSCYGYHLKTSPTMDQLASEGVRFARAYSAIPMTGPSHFSMFTGRYPQEHGARINGVALPDDTKWLTIPQVLRRFGYKSAAFVSAWPLIGRLTRLDRDFDHYDEELGRSYQVFHSMRWAEDVTKSAIRWLDKQRDEQKLFLWVHYFDPHEPYSLREEFADPEQLHEPNPATPQYSEAIVDRTLRYDSEIGYADKYIGLLLGRMDKLGMRENTLVVLVSDHGEGLGEHGFVGHGRWLYESTVHVPWIMRLPGTIRPGTVVEQNVSTLDLAPTLLDLAVPEFREESQISISFAGRSQTAAILEGAQPPKRPIRFVSFEGKKGFAPAWISWVWKPNSGFPFRMGKLDGQMKMIWTPERKRFEFFDLAQDPLELHSQTLLESDRRYKFERAGFERWFESTNLVESESRLTPRDAEILESLGYINR